MGDAWIVSGTHKRVIIDPRLDKHYVAYNEFQASRIKDAFNAYETRIAELESMLASEVQDNAKLRSREAGDEVGNVLQELADLRDELARVKAESLRVHSEVEDIFPEGGVWCYACNRASVPLWGEEPYEHAPSYLPDYPKRTTFRCPICKREISAGDSCVKKIRAIIKPKAEIEA